MMMRFAGFALFAWLCLHASSAAQERVALLYGLPEDGTWIEYKWRTSKAGEGELANLLRISSVGKATFEGKPCRWIEIHKEATRADRTVHDLRKLLVTEEARTDGKPASMRVLSAFAQRGLDGPVTRLRPERIVELTGLGFQGAESGLVMVANEEQVRTGLGVFRVRHVTARAKDGERTLVYHGWLSPDVPFGWVKFEVREAAEKEKERLIFTATVRKTGQAARSRLDETKAHK